MRSAAGDDAAFLRRALTLAGRGRTHPNPRVGAVLVRDGVVVGEGWHRGLGTPHAEAMAFAAAGDAARGATLYVTLEPCSHERRADGSVREPCARRCLEAGVARVVCAMEDPDRQVSGGGFARLRAAGVALEVGLYAERARELNRAYVKHRATGLPFVLHKAAMTLDGKIAAVGGDARWVSGERSRAAVHRLRARVDAVAVGVGTVLADDPSLSVRLPRGNAPDPLRVVLDSRLRTPPGARVSGPGTVVLTTEAAAETAARAVLEARGVRVVGLPADGSGRVDARAAALWLASEGLLEVLLESGGALAAAFHGAGLVDAVWFFVAPKLIGGASAPTPVDGAGLSDRMAGALRLTKMRVRRYGEDVSLEARVIADPDHDGVGRSTGVDG